MTDAGDLHREIVGLGAGAHEVARVQIARQDRPEPLGELDHVLVQVAGVGVEQSGLLVQSAATTRGWAWPTDGTLL